MTGPPCNSRSVHGRVLEKARSLAEEVRQTAERVHQQARESRRLTKIARLEAERGRELSRTGRGEARAVQGTIESSIDVARKACRHLRDKDDKEEE